MSVTAERVARGFEKSCCADVEAIRDNKNSRQYQCFGYDTLDRLTEAYTDTQLACNGHTPVGESNYDDTYAYDAGGNLLSHTGTGEGTQRGVYTYGDSDLAHGVTSISDGSVFRYDDNGNMTLRNLDGQSAQTLVWDTGRRLAEVVESNTTVASFLYGADDSRVRRKVGEEYTFYHADGTEYFYDDSTGEGYFTYYHQMSGRMIGYTRSDTGVTTWTGSDMVNSTSATRDENGESRVQRYTPFGELRNSGNLTTDHLFTGQVLDQDTGLAFYNARYYDPAIGRFITPDSIVPNPNDGQDYNRYTYVRNNPVKYSDPSGNCPTLCTQEDRDLVEQLQASFRAPSVAAAPYVSNTNQQVGCGTRSFNACGDHSGGIGGHDLLDVGGMIPVIGMLFDGANGVWYAVEGDWTNAAISGVAFVPGIGWVAPCLRRCDEAAVIIRNTNNAPSGAVGFTDDAVGSAFQGMRRDGGHASRHLVDEGLIPNSGSLASRVELFEDLTPPLLTNPAKTFDWRLGNTATRAFAGDVGGTPVVVFVAKDGPYQGVVVSAVVPDANQIAQWGL